jgi:phenylalanyl-tRNA synthetase alpha chain
VWVREGLSVANLKWILETFFKYLYGQDTTVRYRLSYFPFTEPSFEVDVKCPNCKGKGCNICKHSG